jgi:hypothetical protein
MTIISSDRRLKPRIEINGSMTYHTENSAETHQGKLEDMSNRGARIWIGQELPATSQLICRIEADDRKEGAMEFRATLLHALPEKRNALYGYGCTIEETELPD